MDCEWIEVWITRTRYFQFHSNWNYYLIFESDCFSLTLPSHSLSTARSFILIELSSNHLKPCSCLTRKYHISTINVGKGGNIGGGDSINCNEWMSEVGGPIKPNQTHIVLFPSKRIKKMKNNNSNNNNVLNIVHKLLLGQSGKNKNQTHKKFRIPPTRQTSWISFFKCICVYLRLYKWTSTKWHYQATISFITFITVRSHLLFYTCCLTLFRFLTRRVCILVDTTLSIYFNK